MVIPPKASNWSATALRALTNYGSSVIIKDISKSDMNAGSDMHDMYANNYDQVQNETPVVSKSYELHGTTIYSPSIYKRKGAGLSEECDVMVTLITSELIDKGLLSLGNDVSEIPDKLKLNKIVNLQGKDFIVKEVGLASAYQDFVIVINLGCASYL